MKFLVSDNNDILTIDATGNVKKLGVKPIKKNMFDEGLDIVNGVMEKRNTKTVTSTFQLELEDGKLYKTAISKIDFPVIKKVSVI